MFKSHAGSIFQNNSKLDFGYLNKYANMINMWMRVFFKSIVSTNRSLLALFLIMFYLIKTYFKTTPA